jgi:hypothetical protein
MPAEPVAPKISVAPESEKSNPEKPGQERPGQDRPGQEKPSLNDRFSGQGKQQPTLAEKLKKSKSGSIRNHISLNQRFMFVKELFGGNTQEFNTMLDELDQKNSLAEADHYVQSQVANRHRWPEESEAVQEFQNVLEVRFS